MREAYPTDVTREQFEQILPLLESARKKTKPREVDLYEIFCALLYLLKTGCQWRMLPKDFPKWKTVYSYFEIWREAKPDEASILEQCLKKIGWRGPYKTGEERLYDIYHRRFPEC